MPDRVAWQDFATVEELTMSTATIGQAYNYKVVRQFVVATIVWGVVGMAMGVWIASQLVVGAG
jgi:cytochrome c oxidase cbb3-type subunit 1